MNEELKITIKANIDEAKKGLQNVQNELEKTGKSGETFKKVLNNMSSVAKSAGKAIGASMAAVGASLVALGANMAKNISQVAELGDNIDKSSQKLGMSAESYQEWDFILQHCGSSVDGLQGTMKALQKAANGNSEAFAALGISQSEVASMNKEELFNKTIEGLQGISDEGQRAKLATELLGRGAAELGPLLNTSAAETEAMRKQVHDLGGVMSNDAVKNAANFQDSLQNLKTSVSGAKNTVFSEFLPSITTVMDGLTGIFSGDKGALGKINKGITEFTNKLSQKLPQVIKAGASIMNNLLKAITSNLPQLLQAGVEVIAELAKGITQNASAVVSAVIVAAEEIVKALPDIISAIVNELPNLITTLIDGIVQFILILCENLNSIIDPIINALPDIINAIVDGLLKNLPALIQGVVQLTVGLTKATSQIIKILVPMIPTIIGEIVKELLKCLPDIIIGVLEICGSVIELVISFFGSIVDYMKNYIKAIFSILGVIGGWVNDNVIKPVANFFKGLWDSIKNVFSNIGSWFKTKFNEAVTGIKNVFSGIGNFFSGIWNSIKNIFKNVGATIGNAITNTVKTAVNGVLSTATKIINGFIKAINVAISVINAIPGVSISKLKELSVPKLATGGIATRSTLANIGEAGKEAVLPLERNTEWMDILADRINGKQASPTKIVLMLGEKQLGEACIDSINSITRTTGTLPLTIV